MNTDEIWLAIDSQRRSVTELLGQLSDEEWRQPSLCAGWTVRDVAAHLTLQQATLASLAAALPAMVRARGDLERAIRDMSCRRAVQPTDRLIAAINAMIGSRRHNPAVTCRETLIDILVHGQDIALPLGRRLDMPPDAAAEAASRVWSLSRRLDLFHAKERLHGYRLTATDIDWTTGVGPEVQAPIAAILLLLTGRLVALPRLSGAGAPGLAAKLAIT
jgi:uncharacterized protein (TIGR03083 family)